MPTNKPTIQAYISPWIAEALQEYRTEKNLSQSQAIEEILAAFFNDLCPLIDRSVIASATERIDKLSEALEEIRQALESANIRLDRVAIASEKHDSILDKFARDIGKLQSSLPDEVPNELLTEPAKTSLSDESPDESLGDDLLSKLNGKKPKNPPSDESPSEAPNDLPILEAVGLKIYSQEQLARRLGVNSGTLSRKRNSPGFKEWAKKKDLQGMEWEWNKAGRNYTGRFPQLVVPEVKKESVTSKDSKTDLGQEVDIEDVVLSKECPLCQGGLLAAYDPDTDETLIRCDRCEWAYIFLGLLPQIELLNK